METPGPPEPRPSQTPNPCKCLKEKEHQKRGGKGELKTDGRQAGSGEGKNTLGFCLIFFPVLKNMFH